MLNDRRGAFKYRIFKRVDRRIPHRRFYIGQSIVFIYDKLGFSVKRCKDVLYAVKAHPPSSFPCRLQLDKIVPNIPVYVS